MKVKTRSMMAILLSTLLCFSPMLITAAAIDGNSEANVRVQVNFTLDEFISSLEEQGFEVEILDCAISRSLLVPQRKSTRIKITRDLPPEMVTPFGTPIPGKAYLIANYEEENITGIAYPYFVSHIGHGIELNSSRYSYESHWSDYRFTNGNFSVEWNGSGQFTYTSSSAISVGFDWFSYSTGDSFVYRSPAYGWEFSYDFPQPV